MNLYSPPNKGYPQELPDRWRFDDGTVRTDLKSLTNSELAALGWVGPITTPTAKQVDEDGNVTEEGDYDGETHKAVWYAAERRYVIVEKHIDETPFVSGETVSNGGGVSDWDSFRLAMVSSVKLNQFIVDAMNYAPIAALTLPNTILNIENDNYGKFAASWGTILASGITVPEDLIEEVLEAAKICNLPAAFISLIINKEYYPFELTSQPEVPVDNPVEPEVPVEEPPASPVEPEVPVDNPIEPEVPVDNPVELEVPVEEPIVDEPA